MVKKNIPKILISIMLINSIYFNQNALAAQDKELNRYETLQGKEIYINNSYPGEISEISLFGETIQNDNNLEDIQSVGELYTDSKGEPILDSQGREQYKINLLSCLDYSNYENFNSNQFPIKSINTSPWSSQYFTNHMIPITNVNDSFDLVIIRKDNENVLSGQAFFRIFATIVDNDGNLIKNLANYTMMKNKEEMVFNKKIGNLKDYVGHNLVISFRDIDLNSSKVGVNLFENFDIGLKNESINEIFPLGTDFEEVELILPTQLMKVGNIADELYWDNEKNRYLIRKNVANIHLKDTEKSRWYTRSEWSNGMHFKLGEVSEFNFNVYEKQFSTINKLRGSTGNGVGSNVCGVDLHNRMVIELSEYNMNNFDDIWDWIQVNNPNFYITYWSPQTIETNITKKIKIPTYNVRTTIVSKTSGPALPTFKVTVDRIEKISQEAVNQAESNTTSSNISLARMYVNLLPDSLYKDQLQEQLNQLFSADIVLDKYNATANLDVYIKSENLLSMSLDTNSITFDNYSGIDELEKLKAINISIHSSLPYSLNAYIPSEIKNVSNTKTMDLSVLNIKESSEDTYKTFNNTTDKLILKDDCVKGNNKSHSIDLKLASDLAHEADVYKTVLKFEVTQK